jgi:hypothetical protein
MESTLEIDKWIVQTGLISKGSGASAAEQDIVTLTVSHE